jgi:hypothetical protein
MNFDHAAWKYSLRRGVQFLFGLEYQFDSDHRPPDLLFTKDDDPTGE